MDSNSFEMATQQTVEMISSQDEKDESMSLINDTTGLDVHVQDYTLLATKTPVCVEIKSSMYNEKKTRKPKFVLDGLVPKEVNWLTGFLDIVDLLSYAIIVCGGDIAKLQKTTSTLACFEEWVFYFEYEYSHVHHRWKDFEKQMDLQEKSLRKIIVLNKLSLAVACRHQRPLYASLKEDEELRS